MVSSQSVARMDLEYTFCKKEATHTEPIVSWRINLCWESRGQALRATNLDDPKTHHTWNKDRLLRNNEMLNMWRDTAGNSASSKKLPGHIIS